ncbi:MAG TPA: hypothetical protein VIK74_04575 [Parasegetibacter sp.]|jgi:hypothetical protein
MKYSNYLGILGAALAVMSAFLPWAYIETGDLTITGMNTEGTSYGKPALINIFMSCCCIFLFLLRFIWAKRANVFFAGFNLAWAIRNFLIINTCFAGDCPEKKTGIYLLLVAAALVMFGALLPPGRVNTPTAK